MSNHEGQGSAPDSLSRARSTSDLLEHIMQLWDSGDLGREEALHIAGGDSASGYTAVVHIIPNEQFTDYMFPRRFRQ